MAGTKLSYGGGLINVFKPWPDFKALVLGKGLLFQYEERVVQHSATFYSQYDIFALDGQMVYTTMLYKTTIAPVCDWSQGDNDTWVAEFEASYQATANAPNQPRSSGGAPLLVLPSSMPSVLSNTVRRRLKDGSTESLIVDGSSQNKVYKVSADPTKTIRLHKLRFTLVANAINLDGTKFASGGALTHGLKVSATLGGVETELANLQINEDFFELASPDVMLNFDGTTDVLVATFDFDGSVALVAGSQDQVAVTVRDNLTTAQLSVKHLKVLLVGAKE